jgi:uncharacterized membrane protein HdeD (DUF308 family)
MSLTTNTLPPGLEDARRLWFFFLLLGGLLFVGGIVAVICSWAAGLISIMIWGWLLMLRGVLEGMSAFWARRFTGSLLHLLLGVIAIMIGVLIVSNPVEAIATLTLLLAVFLIIGGLLQALASLFILFPGWGYSLVSGVIGFAIGLMVWRGWPYSSVWFIGVLAGAELITRGSAWMGIAFDLKKRAERAARAAAAPPPGGPAWSSPAPPPAGQA